MQADLFVVFTHAGKSYALPAATVHSCLSLPRLTALDDTAPWVIGAFDLHGELTPVISIGAYPGAQPAPAGRGDLVIVTVAGGHPLGLHADGLLGTEPAAAAGDAQAPPDQGAATRRVLLAGGRACLVLPERLPISASDAGSAGPRADLRLDRFEARLEAADLEVMERRAARYSGLVDVPARAASRQ
jgi:chemotaxis signal transduction protein